MNRCTWAVLTALIAGCAPRLAGESADEIVKRSIQADDRNQKLIGGYIFKEQETQRELDGSGQTKITRRTTREILSIGGKRFSHVLEKDGKPLPPADGKKEQAKLDKAFAEAAKLSDEEKARRADEQRRQRAKDREIFEYIPAAYDLKLEGQATLNGRPAWVIDANPTGRYDGKYANLLRNIKGKLWIDQQDYQWVKLDAVALNDIAFGFVMGRVSKGMKLDFEQTKVNGEVWLPRSFHFLASERFLFKRLSMDEQLAFSDYRKFQADSRIISIGEAPSVK
jgi:hypothetical protein